MDFEGFLLLFAVSLTFVREGAAACGVITDSTLSQSEGKRVTLSCTASNQAANQVTWTSPGGEVISTDCTTSKTRFTIDCTTNQNNKDFNLKFNVTWGDKGTWKCKCENSEMSTSLTVKVPPKILIPSCTVTKSGKVHVCNKTQLVGSNTLSLAVTVGCSYPSPTVTWTDEVGNPIDTATSGNLAVVPCTGANAGLSQVLSTFTATWDILGKSRNLHVASNNEAGGKSMDLHIQDEPGAPDNTAIAVGVTVTVVLLIVLIGLIIFLVLRAKRKRARNAYV